MPTPGGLRAGEVGQARDGRFGETRLAGEPGGLGEAHQVAAAPHLPGEAHVAEGRIAADGDAVREAWSGQRSAPGRARCQSGVPPGHDPLEVARQGALRLGEELLPGLGEASREGLPELPAPGVEEERRLEERAPETARRRPRWPASTRRRPRDEPASAGADALATARAVR